MIETTVRIDGMMCGMCEAHVNDAVRKEFDVKKVTSSHKKGTMTVLSEEPLDPTRLANAIKASGYDFVESVSGEYKKKGLFGRG